MTKVHLIKNVKNGKTFVFFHRSSSCQQSSSSSAGWPKPPPPAPPEFSTIAYFMQPPSNRGSYGGFYLLKRRRGRMYLNDEWLNLCNMVDGCLVGRSVVFMESESGSRTSNELHSNLPRIPLSFYSTTLLSLTTTVTAVSHLHLHLPLIGLLPPFPHAGSGR